MSKFFLTILVTLFLTAYSVLNVFAEQQKHGEYEIKAAYIYNFINFIDWPPESNFYGNQSINLCIFGDDPFGKELDDIKNEFVKGKKLTIKYYSSLEKLKSCNILFIPVTEKNHVAQIVKSIRTSNVLTISDAEEMAQQGVIINFFLEKKKVRFAINIEAARQAGLKISAKLLKLAKIIHVREE